ncbi:MAG: hypothetical protein ABSA72_04135 [Nitrososphaerales archaeon]
MKEAGFGVEIRRNAEVKLFPFTDYFVGFEKVAAVKSLFGAKTAEVLRNLKVEFFSLRFGYMSVSDEDGHILISTNHLKKAEMKVLYLDVVHELYHVKQFMEGKKLFQDEFEYVDSPIEVPAYKFTVEEAKRIGMSMTEIVEYLKVEWVTEEQHARLVKTLALS